MQVKFVSYKALTKDQEARAHQACGLLSIQHQVSVEPIFEVHKELKTPTMQSDDKGFNIDELSIYRAVGKADNIMAIYSREDFTRLGIRKSLYGQGTLVDDTGVAYIADDPKYKNHKKYPEPYKSMNHLVIQIIHELTHIVSKKYGFDSVFADSHYHLYGYDRLYRKSEEDKAKRWVRTPDLLGMWKTIPFEKAVTVDNSIKEINGIKMMSWLDPKSIKVIVLHHTAVQTKGNQKKSVEDRHDKLYGNYIYQKYGRRTSLLGSPIGYNLFIDVLSPLEQCRVLGEETTANKGQNGTNRDNIGLSLCIAGDFTSKVDLSDNEDTELSKLIPILTKTFPNAEFKRHGDLPYNNTTCSGKLSPLFIKQYIPEYKSVIHRLIWQIFRKLV